MIKKSLTNFETTQLVDPTRIDFLYTSVAAHIDNARENVKTTIDVEMVKAYWLTGRDIVLEEQQGSSRAEYGKAILKNLSIKLQKKI